MSTEEVKPIYEWCEDCEGPVIQPKDTICLACIRLTLREQNIKLSRPASFEQKEL